jgi:hypothetical protein
MGKLNSEIDIHPGVVMKIFSSEESRIFENNWMDVFCKNRQGVNTKNYKWHIFSGGKYPSISGSDAINKYLEQKAFEVIVLSNSGNLCFLTNLLPKTCSLSDYYVFPENMAWTMAFTHEDGWLGPYFAIHKNYESLNKQNISYFNRQAEKHDQIENAKNKGWL